MNSPRILFLSSWFPDRITLTNGDFIKRHAEAVASKFPVFFLFVKYDNMMTPIKEVFDLQEGNYFERVVYFRIRGKIFLRARKTLRFLCLYLQEYRNIYAVWGKPDIVHANITYPIGILALYLKFRFKIPFVLSEHWSAYLAANSGNLSAIRKWVDRRVIWNAACVMPVTENLKNSMQKLGYTGNYEVIPNVVDVQKFSIGKKKDRAVKHFIHLSTLYDEVKNISGIIEAVSILAQKRNDFVVNVYGFAEIDKHIEKAKTAGINGSFIIFHGEIPYDEVPAKLQQSDALLMFSNFESLPCVIVESLACGIPVISTDVGGIKEYISPKEGRLIEKGDVKELVETMNFMLDNLPEYDNVYLSNFARQHFSVESIATRFGTIYKSVLSDA